MYEVLVRPVLAIFEEGSQSSHNARADGDPSKRVYLQAAFTVEGKHQAFPLPGVQVDLSEVDGTPMLAQNPGF